MNIIIIVEKKEYDYIKRCLKIPTQILIWEEAKDIDFLYSMKSEEEFCFVVVMKEQSMRHHIMEWLNNYFPGQTFIDFYQIYNATMPVKICDRVLVNPNVGKFEGIFLGLSHAEVGIVPELLKVPFANLAVSSQDIYYNYQILKHAINKYSHKVKDVKYVFIDMYRYNYFNFDVSKSKVAERYFKWSGMWDDGHNYDLQQYQYLADLEMIKRLEGITDEKLDIWMKLFEDVHRVDGYKNYEAFPELYRRIDIVNDENVRNMDFNEGIVRNRFSGTISENIEYMKQLLQLIKETWLDVKIVLINFPLYELNLEQSEWLFKPWEKEFYEIIDKLREVADFEYIDYTKHEISKKKLLWYDHEHFNYQGAIQFTQEINKLL